MKKSIIKMNKTINNDTLTYTIFSFLLDLLIFNFIYNTLEQK